VEQFGDGHMTNPWEDSAVGTTFETLRDLVMHYAARRGWRTQRHIAVACGFDESGLSRFLNGEQDIGARRTHALFQAVGIPVEQYDLAYALLGQAQEQARANRRAWLARRQALVTVAERGSQGNERSVTASRSPSMVALARSAPVAALDAAFGAVWLPPDDGDIPSSAVIAKFRMEGATGAEIAAFFSALGTGAQDGLAADAAARFPELGAYRRSCPRRAPSGKSGVWTFT
jgi:hypothetical protein